ncbi:MAG: hypothetical protein EU541_02640 [Promethearchaeota archaeon]|nr:MAG: hypothetical protein EU541_02640 [Candidatus Lokiarchaeota archaeon]
MKLDLDEIQEGLISLSAIIFVFSIAIMIISILFKPYLILDPWERDYIVLVSGFNIPFCIYYAIEAIRLSEISGLDQKYTLKFILRTCVVSAIYIVHLVFLTQILFSEVILLEKIMVFILFLLEIFLIGIIFRLGLWKLIRSKHE